MVHLSTDPAIYRQKAQLSASACRGHGSTNASHRRPCTMVGVRWPFEEVVASDPPKECATQG